MVYCHHKLPYQRHQAGALAGPQILGGNSSIITKKNIIHILAMLIFIAIYQQPVLVNYYKTGSDFLKDNHQ